MSVSYTHLDVYKRQHPNRKPQLHQHKNNLEILHYTPKSRKLNTAEQYEIYKHNKTQPNNIHNEQLQFKSNTLFDTII